MKVYCIETAPIPFKDRLLIHHYIFHGVSSRKGGSPVYDSNPAFLTTSRRVPLDVCRTGTWMPAISSPNCNLVVAEDVRNILADFPPIEFLQVRFKNLINLPISKKGGITAIKDEGFRIDPLSKLFLRTRANVPAFRRTIGNHFEVLTARVADLLEQYPNVRKRNIVVGDPKSGAEETQVRLSRRMCEDYPLLTDGPWIIRDDVYSRIESYFDWRFFSQCEVQLR